MKIFCCNCLTETEHSLTADKNAEIVCECTTANCNHFLKIPAGFTTDQVVARVAIHKEHNDRPIVTAVQESAKHKATQDLIAELNK